MEIMKIVFPVCLFLVTTCFAIENSTTKLEELNVQKREKGYLIEDDPTEGPEQKRDERQSTPVINNRNLDPKGNSRIINIRLQPTPNILTAPKQAIKPGPQRIPTKIPVVLKTAKVVPSPAHAVRMKMLENRINETRCNTNKQNNVCLNNAPPTTSKDSIPYYTIEDKTSRRSESPNNINDENPNPGSNKVLSGDGNETSGSDEKNPLNKYENDSLNEGKDDQNISNFEKKAAVHKPVHFFVDEPEPLPPSFRRQQKYENTASQNKEASPNKIKEISIEKKGNKKPKKDETRKIDDDNDPDIIKISNGTHLISIKKIPNHERYNTERLPSRIVEEDTAPTEERIINHSPPEPKPMKTTYGEPEKHSFSITEKISTGKEPKLGIIGFPFKDNKNQEGKGQNNCITITNYDCEEFEEKSPIDPRIILQTTNPLKTFNNINQESWNYLQNPYYNPYYQNTYDQYRRNNGLAQINPNPYGQEVIDSRYHGAQINPCIYHQATVDPCGPEMNTAYYPNLSLLPDTDSTQYLYNPSVYENQPEIGNTACALRQEVRPENTLDRIRKYWKDLEIKVRNSQMNGTDVPLDIDIRRDIDRLFDGAKVENEIAKVANPYTASSQPITINGALIYPYVNPSYRHMR